MDCMITNGPLVAKIIFLYQLRKRNIYCCAQRYNSKPMANLLMVPAWADADNDGDVDAFVVKLLRCE